MEIPLLMSNRVGTGLVNLSPLGAKRLQPHWRCSVTPFESPLGPLGTLVSLATASLEKLQRKPMNPEELQFAALQKGVISNDSWGSSISIFLGCYGFSWRCWIFVLWKAILWSAGRGDSQNYVRKLYSLHLLQLPLQSFAVPVRESRIRIWKGPLAPIAPGIKICQLPSPHFDFFQIYVMHLPRHWILFQLFYLFSFLSLRPIYNS